MMRHNWTLEELKQLYDTPLMQLIAEAASVHKKYHKMGELQICHLISIKTGGCPEDCKYCAQSSRYETEVKAQPMMSYEQVLERAKKAAQDGATRVCLGAAWKAPRSGKAFDEVLRMVQGISGLGLEVCCTLGTLNSDQAARLKESGLYAYNHNLDSSEEFYKTIITTRTYQERLDTLDVVAKQGLSVCCGGILGMGETVMDRLELLRQVSRRSPHPESFPVNRLSVVDGTPLEDQEKMVFWDYLRYIAVARIVLPMAMIRLSAGRNEMSFQEQALCFFAGANSIFSGEKLLTVGNNPIDQDREMITLLGMMPIPAYSKENDQCLAF